MAGRADKKELRDQALANLAGARLSLHDDVARMRTQWSPKTLIQHSVERHKTAYIVGAVVVGLLVTKLLFSGGRENSRDSSVKTARKRTLASLMLAGLWSVARGPLMGIAQERLLPVILPYITQYFSPPPPDRPA